MSNKTADVNEQMAYLSSGKRILTAKDDAIQYGTLAGYNDSLANIDKYQRNITQAESHNNSQEVIFSNAEDILNNINEKMLQANNGAMSNEDLQAIADEVRNGLDQILDLANTQNENGDYIFSGYQTDQQPFSQKTDGSVSYNGDSGVRELQISKNINIVTSQSGDASFMNIANAIGDFTASYPTVNANTSGMALSSANVTDRSTYNTSSMPHNYTFNFDAITADLTVTDSGGNDTVFPVSSYTGGQTISFDGIEVTLSGNPLPGESFNMSAEEEISIFDTLNDAISWIEQGVVSTDTEQHQVEYNAILDQLNLSMIHITSRRIDSGVRLQVLESQESRHLDEELNISTNKSTIEDLDYAKAISAFEQSQTALTASQQTFSTVQGLSLFNYI